MSIDADIFKRDGIVGVDAKDEQARRAVKQFRGLQPTLSAYARILTKNPKVRVEMAARDNGSTDGHRIYYRPPLALGSPVAHERRQCDKRDDRMQPVCPACKIREEVLVTIYHEIAHICFDTFAETSDRDRASLIEKAVEQVSSKYAARVKARIEAAPPLMKTSYMGMAGLVNEFLPTIVNALEDARINGELFKARKGTKVMFDADTWRTFLEGVEQKDAEGNVIVKEWNTYPLNSQIIAGLFCKASGYDYSEWFVPPVVEALDDEELTNILRRLETTRSAAGVYHLSFPVLARLRELGFCQTDMDPDEDEEEEQEDGPGDSEEDESGQEGSSEGEPEEGEGESSEGPSSSADEDAGGGEDPEAEGEESHPDGDGASSEQDQPEGSGQGEPVDEPGGESDGEDRDESSDEASGSSDREDESEDRPGGELGESSSSGEPEDESPEREEQSSDGSSGAPDQEGSEDRDSEGEVEVDASDDSPEPEDESGGGDESSRSGSPDDSDSNSQQEGNDNPVSGSGDGEGIQEPDQSDATGPSSSDSSLSPTDSGDDGEGSESEGTESDDGLDGESASDDDTSESEVDSEPDASAEREVEQSSQSEDSDEGEVDEDGEPIDSGADDGQGGTEVIENPEYDDLPMGDPEETRLALLKWMDHEEKPKSIEEKQDENAVDRALIQGIYFETPSRNIWGVREHRYDEHVYVGETDMSVAWDHSLYGSMGFDRRQLGISGDFMPAESALGPALLRMRVAFSDNQRGAEIRHKKSGRVDARVLGKRAPSNDERLFKKKILPGKKNYFVLLGMDVSGSTIGNNIVLEKECVFAQAELLSRMGIPFAIYAHSGNLHNPTRGRADGLDLDIYFVKEKDENWDPKVQERLTEIGPGAANLDGHTLEYYRKVLDSVDATDKVLLYYTDGKMPAENHDEELEILQREIKICARKNYHLLGVGIRTDSPVRHGLDTVQVDEHADVVKVVKHLEKRLLAT